MAKQVWFVLPQEECSINSIADDTNLSLLSQYSLPDMDGSKDDSTEHEIPPIDPVGGHNQTGSTNDSRDGGSTNVSSPSLQRGFSSDDGSGWRSETTETSEDTSQTDHTSSQSDIGNFSIPNYPIDDRSADESAHSDEPHEEVLTSAINEVSKDFISGNFSPTKYPHIGSGDSDSYSDGDQRQGHEHRGAVYARYPESATGLSDCEWNPYATESDTNHTPRSSCSETSNRGNVLTSVTKKDWNDPIASVAKVNIPQVDKILSGVTKHDTRAESGGESDRSSKHSSRSPTFEEEYQIPKGSSASYMLYPPEQQILSDNSDSDNAKQKQKVDNKSDKRNQSPTRESGEPVNLSKSSQVYCAHSGNGLQANGNSENVHGRSRIEEKSQASGAKSTTGEQNKQKLGSYVPVDERQKLMSDRERLLNGDVPTERNRLSDSALPNNTRTSQEFERDEKSSRSSLPDPDTLSRRVTKLLDEANNLGAALHTTLYESKGNVLVPPKYSAFSPERTKSTPLYETSVLPMNKNYEKGVSDRSEKLNLENSGRSNLSETSGGGSSLSEEVAKLMSHVEASSSRPKIGEKKEFKRTPAVVHETPPKKREDKPSSRNSYERSDLDQIYKSISEKKETRLGDVKGTPIPQKNYDSDDSLGERVKDLLTRTAHTKQFEKHPPVEQKVKSLPYQSQVSSDLDYSLLQRDLQEIQNNLDTNLQLPIDDQDSFHAEEKDSSGRSSEKDLCLDGSKSSDKSTTSTVPGSGRDRKLMWDHAADLGYDSSDSTKFQGKFQDFAGSDTDKTLFSQTGNDKTYASNAAKVDEVTLTNGGDKQEDDAISDQLEELNDVPSRNYAPDVEEIIAKYQKERNSTEYQEDASGLASRVFRILTQEPPQKQVFGILEEAMEQEREMMQKMAERSKMDSSYRDDFSLESGSFVVRDKDIKKQLDWSAMSSINGEQHNDKTSDLSALAGLTSAPYSALGNAQNFLSSQLQKTSERTFNHSIEMSTPYKRVIECYPLYGVERDRKGTTDSDPEKQATKEAWPIKDPQQNRNDNVSSWPSDRERPEDRDQGSNGGPRHPVDRLASERFFLNQQDQSPDRHQGRQRTLSDPRDVSPERERHTRSLSEEARIVGPDDRYYNIDCRDPISTTDRRITSSSPYRKDSDDVTDVRTGDVKLSTKPDVTRPEDQMSPLQVNVESQESLELQRAREDSHGSNSPQEQMNHSPTESDTSSKRRETSRLRPYRPLGSRDLYYTESGDDSGSVADSITTIESTHTGSDDAVAPHIPPQYLGSRQDSASSGSSTGIYGNRQTKSSVLPEALSTIEERSISDEKERSAEDRIDNRDSASEEERIRPPSNPRHHDSGLDLDVGRDRYERREENDVERDIGDRGNPEGNLDSSIRSDPGKHLATPKRVKKYELSTSDHQLNETSDRSLSQEYIYGRSRSRSETDLYNLPPDADPADHKSSSPMYGPKVMEMSSRPSPIYSHHSNLESPAVRVDDVRIRESRSSVLNPRDDPDRRPISSESDQLGKPPAFRELASIGPMEARALGLRSSSDVGDQKARTADEQYFKDRLHSRPLDKGPDYFDAFIRESIARRNAAENVSMQYDIQPGDPRLDNRGNIRPYADQLRRDDREVEPMQQEELDEQRRDPTRRLYSPVLETRRSISPVYGPNKSDEVMEVDGRVFRELPQVPDTEFEDTVKQERDRLKGELTKKMGRITRKLLTGHSDDEHEIGSEVDHIPLSARAKALQERLERQNAELVPPNINDMWERFQEINQNESESSINASRMETLADLLKNPTRHLVQKYLDDQNYERYKEKKLLEELAELDRQQRKYHSGQKELEAMSQEEKELRKEIDRKRKELQNRRKQTSEEESNGSYAEILAQNERKKLESDRKKKDKNIKNKSSKKHKFDKLCDSADTLFSIPEDVSFDTSDVNRTSESDMMLKAKHGRHRHVIDPLMSKLHGKVQRQRDKIDKERRKELRRMEKLQKLEMLLTAKRKGKLSDKAINVELDYVSTTSTTMTSDSSSTLVDSGESTLTDSQMDSDRATIDTTSTKDSSVEYQKKKLLKQKQMKDAYTSALKSGYMMEDSDMQSESDIFQKPRKSKSAKHGSEKKKSKKTRSDSDSKKRRDKELYNKLLQHLSPESKRREHSPHGKRNRSPGGKKFREVGTMYPSPIQISPPRRRRHKDVSMVSEAIQTTLRSISPSRDEIQVVSVPLMSPQRKHKSPSPSKSISPVTAKRRQPSRSPQRKSMSPHRRNMSDYSSYHKTPPPPPKSRIFTPETPDDEFPVKPLSSPKGVTWYIPMTESKPWRKPLKEQQAYAIGKEPWQPKSVPREVWKNIVDGDVLNKENTDTKFTLDPPSQRHVGENNSDEENIDPKPRTKMSLQEAFQIYKQDVISRSRARERRIMLASEHRELQSMLNKERQRLFAAEQRRKEANPEAHPYSENLHKPKRRSMTKEEMKQLTEKKYKNLPEVVQGEKLRKRNDQYALNRLRAKVFNRKIQKQTLRKCNKT